MAERRMIGALLNSLVDGLDCILFDLDGTLRHNQPSSVASFFDCAVRLGAADDLNRRRQAMRWTHYYWAQSPELFDDLQKFGGMDEAFWLHYAFRSLEAYGISNEEAQTIAPQVHRYMTDEHQPSDYIPPDVTQTLARLKQAGFCLGVISNRSAPFHDYLDETGLAEYFNLALAASEANSWKPDPLIFQHALDRLGADPGRALYVGDNYYADVLGALNAGIQPVLFDPDRVFPDASCPVIYAIGELGELANWRAAHNPRQSHIN